MISEIDQQLLDEFLDGQLAPAEAQRLALRLAAEPALAEELSALRAGRESRTAVFAALEPELTTAETFSRRVISASRRQALRSRFAGLMRIGAGIAACIAVGFVAGWLGRGHGADVTRPNATPIAVNRTIEQVPAMPVVDRGRTDRSAMPAGQVTGPFQVSLTDPDGHVLAVEKFDRIEDANAFTDSMDREAHRLQSNSDYQPVADVVQGEQF